MLSAIQLYSARDPRLFSRAVGWTKPRAKIIDAIMAFFRCFGWSNCPYKEEEEEEEEEDGRGYRTLKAAALFFMKRGK